MKMAYRTVVLTQPEVLYPQLSSFQMVAPLEITLWFPVSLKVFMSQDLLFHVIRTYGMFLLF